jgi:peptidoglycan/xylan/chitin deacetylase (PgdA/CDA1 family)
MAEREQRLEAFGMAGFVSSSVHSFCYWSGVSTHLASRIAATRIFMFHGVDGSDYPVSLLERQLGYLARHFAVVSLDAALAEPPAARDRRRVVLTFDDGLRNNYTQAYPVLQKLQLPAVFYVCPGIIDRREWLWNHEARERLRALPEAGREELRQSLGAPRAGVDAVVEWLKTLPQPERQRVGIVIREATASFVPSAEQRRRYDVMDWDELRSLDPALVTIGSHSLSHPILTTLDDPDLRREVDESADWLERSLRRTVRHFCYPNGDEDERVVALARQRYASAVTTRPGLVAAGADRHRLNRIATASSEAVLAWRMHRPPRE